MGKLPPKKKKWRHLWPFLLSLLAIACLNCDSDEGAQVIAEVETYPITLGEFQERLNNLLLHTTQDNAELHEALLQNLIDEKALIHEAHQRGYHLTEEYRIEKTRLETDILLNAFRENLAQERTNVTEADIQRAFALNHEQVRARILYASDEAKANDYHQRLMAGATFDELAREAFQDPQLSQNGGDMGYFAWEDMDLPFSEAAQQLKIGEISRPVLTRNGWYIIQVEDRFLPPMSETDYHKEYKKLRWTVTHRQKAKSIREYTDKLVADLNITFNESVLVALMREVPVASTTDDVSFSDYGLNDDEVVATVDNQPWPLKTLQEKSKWTSSRQRRSANTIDGLKRFIEGLAVRDILLKQAQASNTLSEDEIQARVQKRLDLYLIEKMNHQIMDTVSATEPEISAYFEQNKSQFVYHKQVNVREILVEDEAQASALLKRVRAGEDFATLAEAHSLRKWAASRGGELGYGAKRQYGIHADQIFAMKPGEIGGPFKTDKYYSIIQMIGSRPAQAQNLEQATPEIKRQLAAEKRRSALQTFTQNLRKSLQINIHGKETP